MFLPVGAKMSASDAVAPGSLIVGQLGSDPPNLIGLRADERAGVRVNRYIVVLNSWEWEKGLKYPRMMLAGSDPVLNLGREWSIDVGFTATAPSFGSRTGPLSFREDRFYLLVETLSYGSYVSFDMKAGDINWNLPDGGSVYWPTFRIMLSQPGASGPETEVFAWPAWKERDAAG